jgi:hypothetical protein
LAARSCTRENLRQGPGEGQACPAIVTDVQRPSESAPLTVRALVGELLARLRELPRATALCVALVCTFAYFVGPPAWNQNSRLALTRALVERGDPIIDDWHATTGDKSFRAGHFYSDKAPGVSLLATLPYAAFAAFRRISGSELPQVRVIPLDPAIAAAGQAPAPDELEPGDVLVYDSAWLAALWLCRMFTVSLASLVAGALFYLVMLRELGGRRELARAAGLLWLLATPAFGYACGFYGHQLVGALLFAAFALIVLCDGHARVSVGMIALIGALLGWAVLSEYTAAVPVALLVAWASVRRGLAHGGFGFGLGLALAGLPWALVLAGYHTWAFGGPLKTGYDFVYLDEFAQGMAINFGIGRPRLDVLGQLTFGSYRGLFYLSPVLLLAVWGLALRMFERPEPSADAGGPPLRAIDLWCCTLIIAYYLLLNSAYYMWDGGASLGPRHAVPMLAFLAVGLGPALVRVPWATVVLGLVSCIHVVLITAAGPEAPGHGNPVWAYAVPRLFADAPPGTATTLGRLLGLPGPLSLLPLLALWWLLWPTRRDRMSS